MERKVLDRTKNMKINNVRRIVRGALIAALYVSLCLLFEPISYSYLQFRVAEALCILPIFLPEAIPALALGCFLSNLFGSAHLLDLLLGPLATLISACLTRKWKKYPLLSFLSPVLINALFVGFTFHLTANLPYWLTAGSVFLGESGVIFTAGLALYGTMRHLPSSLLQTKSHK